jgi:hypothetical protein
MYCVNKIIVMIMTGKINKLAGTIKFNLVLQKGIIPNIICYSLSTNLFYIYITKIKNKYYLSINYNYDDNKSVFHRNISNIVKQNKLYQVVITWYLHKYMCVYINRKLIKKQNIL